MYKLRMKEADDRLQEEASEGAHTLFNKELYTPGLQRFYCNTDVHY